MRTHPMVIIGGILQENPFFIPSEQMLKELAARKAAGRRRAFRTGVTRDNPMQTGQPGSELDSLRQTTRDLVALTTLPAIWGNLPPARVVESLADVLLRTLDLDLVHARLLASIDSAAFDTTRSKPPAAQARTCPWRAPHWRARRRRHVAPGRRPALAHLRAALRHRGRHRRPGRGFPASRFPHPERAHVAGRGRQPGHRRVAAPAGRARAQAQRIALPGFCRHGPVDALGNRAGWQLFLPVARLAPRLPGKARKRAWAWAGRP